MKVKELIKLLQQFDPNTEVVVSGYEGGFTSGIIVNERSLVKNYIVDERGNS
jgi:hypothetical protein